MKISRRQQNIRANIIPEKIQIFTDETKANDKSFIIYSMIYGNIKNISSLNSELKKIIHPIGDKDKDFKGLHAHKLNDSNWKTIGKKFEDSLDKLIEYANQKKIGIKICIIGSQKHSNNAGFLKELIKKELKKKSSERSSQKSS